MYGFDEMIMRKSFVVSLSNHEQTLGQAQGEQDDDYDEEEDEDEEREWCD